MATRRDLVGRGCFYCSLAALYCLLGMKVFVAWRDGLWLDWPLGDVLPNAVVRALFALPDGRLRDILTWLSRQDVIYHVAAIALVLWLLHLAAMAGRGGGGDGFSGGEPPDRVTEV
ncbi:MAG: hypothetical protein ACP59X_10470 [Solidesulfovibrio sp. DCME]|uniref:hypothetical protein n=1 Tax=Solidesulfovibrio sp. DCME TaxID=3447380 RepID=UPI003D14F895